MHHNYITQQHVNVTNLDNWKHLKGNSRQRRVARRKLQAQLPPEAWLEQAGTRSGQVVVFFP